MANTVPVAVPSYRECGVLVPIDVRPGQGSRDQEGSTSELTRQGRQGQRDCDVRADLDTVFRGRVPVPMEWPGRSFTSSSEGHGDEEGERGMAGVPWFYQEG
jgi:hypothetical protein